MNRHHHFVWILASCVALLATARLSAHHKIENAFYDVTHAVTLNGAISRVDWQNPHVYVYVEVRDAGQSQTWRLEGEAPAALMRAGWTKDTLKAGDRVTVHGFLPRQSQFILLAGGASLDLPDGRTLRLGPDLSR
jgi:Family of unknown function (DUF6152)